MRNLYKTLVAKLKGKRPLQRPRHRWEDNITTELREIVWEGVELMQVAQNRDQWRAFVNTVMNIRIP
jgi:hypothetical protein